MEASEVVESYCETIYNMRMEGDVVIGARLAEKFGVAAPTVTETLKRMVRDRLIEMDSRRQITLTPKGIATAEGRAPPPPTDGTLSGGYAGHALARGA